MAKWRPTYEIDENVLSALDAYPGIKNLAKLPETGTSDKYVVRLLQMAHRHEGSKGILDLIERYAGSALSMVQELLRAAFRFEFLGRFTEVKVLHYFTESGLPTRAVDRVAGGRSPDIEIEWSGGLAHVEVNTPAYLQNFQVLLGDVQGVLEDAVRDESDGIEARVGPPQMPGTAPDGGWPADLPKQRDMIREWVGEVKGQVEAWVASGDDELTIPGPAGVELSANRWRGVPRVAMSWGHGTDLYSKLKWGEPEELASGAYGQGIKAKLDARQAGDAKPDVLRILIVDYSYSDTSEREFMISDELAAKLCEVTKHLLDDDLQYDAFITSMLHHGPRAVGRPIALDDRRLADVEKFAVEAGILAVGS